MGGLQVFNPMVFLCFIQKLDTYTMLKTVIKYEFPDFPSLSAFLLSLSPSTKALFPELRLWSCTPQATALPLLFSGG